jgi:hypothetical protein
LELLESHWRIATSFCNELDVLSTFHLFDDSKNGHGKEPCEQAKKANYDSNMLSNPSIPSRLPSGLHHIALAAGL